MKIDITFTREEPHGPPDDLVFVDVEYTVEIEGTVQGADPSVGEYFDEVEWYVNEKEVKGWQSVDELEEFLRRHREDEIRERLLDAARERECY
jgi:hypothetical protein